MFSSITFKNFKVLRNATLQLGPFTLVVGPNGSGKSSATQAFAVARSPSSFAHKRLASIGSSENDSVEVTLRFARPHADVEMRCLWSAGKTRAVFFNVSSGQAVQNPQPFENLLQKVRLYSLDPSAIAQPVDLRPEMELAPSGANLAGVLDRLRDRDPERFDALNGELHRWLPEYDQILFDTPSGGMRSIELRTTSSRRHAIAASELSQGTLLALAILTLGYIPDPPPLACFEEPDRGIHPRLLRQVQDALYRLSHPEAHGETRPPVQVIVTTHSPYFLDLFRDHPEEIVIAQKTGLTATFERLSDRKDLAEILQGTQLGEVWYSGVLGGVPADA